MNDVMQGRWTLLHVIGLVVWQKHVKSLSHNSLDSTALKSKTIHGAAVPFLAKPGLPAVTRTGASVQ